MHSPWSFCTPYRAPHNASCIRSGGWLPLVLGRLDVRVPNFAAEPASLAVPRLGILRRRKSHSTRVSDQRSIKAKQARRSLFPPDAFDGILILECRRGTLSCRQENRGGVFWGDI